MSRKPATKMATEPAVTVGSISAAVAAVLALLVAFGLPLTQEQQTAVLGVVAVVGPLVTAYVTRRNVVPFSPDHGDVWVDDQP